LEKGWIVDRGNPLTQEGRVVNAKKVVVDGPFVESKETVGGYSLVQADTNRPSNSPRAAPPVHLWAAACGLWALRSLAFALGIRSLLAT
jgi:hypothetical protein